NARRARRPKPFAGRGNWRASALSAKACCRRPSSNCWQDITSRRREASSARCILGRELRVRQRMSVEKLFEPLSLARGPAMKNRFMLAPLTNTQSHADGRLSDAEHRWLTMRAEGGFALTMTCAAHVQAGGQGFPGQLGVFGDQHVEGL